MHPVAYAVDTQQCPPTQDALAHQSLAEHEAPAGWLFFSEHLKSASRKWLDRQVRHFPLEESHTEQSEANAVDAQQRPPTQEALAHQLLAEHKAPAGWLFFNKHLASASRK